MPKKTLLIVDKIRENPDLYGMSCGSYCVATLDGKNVSIYPTRQHRTWESCRESFARNWSDLNASHPFMMSVTSLIEQRENIAKFLRITEEKKLKLDEFSKVSGFTNDETAILIEPAKWWTVSELRRQFLTALLRAGLYYYKNPKAGPTHILGQILYIPANPAVILPEYKDYRKALYSIKYFAHTNEAVRKFLSGYTECLLSLSGVRGWYATFDRNMNLDRLIKPR